jgi:hypothetical protein
VFLKHSYFSHVVGRMLQGPSQNGSFFVRSDHQTPKNDMELQQGQVAVSKLCENHPWQFLMCRQDAVFDFISR